jgi:hypothetical protein
MFAAMSRCLFRRFTILLASTLGVLEASAQTPAHVSPNRVTFYTEPNFKGEALLVEAGANVENLDRMKRATQQPWTYAISSIKVEGAARAAVYTGPNFSGERLDVTTSISDLYDVARKTTGASWDRAIASVAVTGPQPPAAALPPVRYETAPPPPTTVYVVPAPPPPPVRPGPPRPVYDPRTVDQVIQRAYREVLGRSADPDGLRHYRQKLLREGWTDRDIVRDLQRSGEARAISADDAIRKAYQEVLGREPDPNGLAHYRSKWKQGWTQGQIRDDLRRSTERRHTAIQEAITRAYRELLGRDPDPQGFATYERLMRERGYTERDIRRAIMDGDEYRQRQAGKRK